MLLSCQCMSVNIVKANRRICSRFAFFELLLGKLTMSDDFIPFNQSTPMQGKWQDRRHNQSQTGYQNNRYQNGNRRGNGHNNRWSNNSHRNSSFGSDSNSSFGRDKNNIEAYLHPAMLKDPWEHLRQASQ